MRHDASAFERVLHDTYVGTLADGTTRNKAQEIAEATRQDRQITKVEFETFDVSDYDATIVARIGGTVHTRLGSSSDPEPFVSKVHYVVTLIRSNGELKIVAIDRSDPKE